MINQTPLEQKREAARAYKGVSYDARIDRFIAMITVNGERRYLGSFSTAEAAGFEYETAREAHPIFRERRSTAKSVHQILVDFDETAERDGGKFNNITAGQIVTLPGKQRYRLEGFKFEHGKGWYAWSSACRCCGARFEFYTSLRLRILKGFTRNCKEHHTRIGKVDGAPDVWPDPIEWKVPPAISPVIASKISEPRKNTTIESLEDLRKGPLRDFGIKYRERFPAASLSEIKDVYVLELEKEPMRPGARQEDLEVLAGDQPADNSDLA